MTRTDTNAKKSKSSSHRLLALLLTLAMLLSIMPMGLVFTSSAAADGSESSENVKNDGSEFDVSASLSNYTSAASGIVEIQIDITNINKNYTSR